MSTWEALSRYSLTFTIQHHNLVSDHTINDSTMSSGLVSGGPGSLIYGFLRVFCLFDYSQLV